MASRKSNYLNKGEDEATKEPHVKTLSVLPSSSLPCHTEMIRRRDGDKNNTCYTTFTV